MPSGLDIGNTCLGTRGEHGLKSWRSRWSLKPLNSVILKSVLAVVEMKEKTVDKQLELKAKDSTEHYHPLYDQDLISLDPRRATLIYQMHRIVFKLPVLEVRRAGEQRFEVEYFGFANRASSCPLLEK